MKTSNVALAVAIGLMTATPAFAEDDAAALKASTDQYKALTENVNAQKGLIDAKVAALNLPTVKGGATITASAGKMEASILSASAMNAAAKSIFAAKPQNRSKFIVLAGAEALDFSLPTALKLEMTALTESATQHACKGDPQPAVMSGFPIAAIGAVINALKVDTEVSGITIEPDSGALAHAVAGKFANLAYVPSEISSVQSFEKSELKTQWKKLRDARSGLATCRGKLANAGDKAEVAVVDASIANIDAFSVRVTQAKDGAPPLFRAAALDTLGEGSPVILRVTAEAAGGTQVKRTNLWTAFGALGVKVTGGLLASYRFVDPSNGQVLGEGLLVCRTVLSNLKTVQAGAFDATCEAAVSAKPRAS